MNPRLIARQLRPAMLLAGAAVVFSACSADQEMPPLGGNPAAADVSAGLELSSSVAAPGSRIAVSIVAQGPEVLGHLQGTLSFNPARLRYVGQAVEGSRLVMIGDRQAPRGELNVLSLDVVDGLPRRTGTLVFEVLGGDYAPSLRYAMLEAGSKDAARGWTRSDEIATADAADLVVPANAKPMSMADWNAALWPQDVAEEAAVAQSRGAARVPGAYVANLRYGDVSLTGGSVACGNPSLAGRPITGVDVSLLANASVGNASILLDLPANKDIVIAGNVATLNPTPPFPGVDANGTRNITGLDVSAVANENVGNARPVVCDFIPGREPAAAITVTLSGSQATNRTLTRDTLYRIDGIYRVNGGATLTILPGTRLEGMRTSTSGTPSALYIERDGRIDAQGTLLQPIVFTCDQTPKFKGCWGGVVIAGNAATNGGQGAAANTSATSPVIAGRAATGGCLEQDYEGSIGAALIRFGGCNDADNSGTIRYARFEYGGFLFQPNKELNNLTLGGVGSGTTLEYIQVHGGSDDGYEIFGGGHNVSHLVITGNSDDGFDYSQGWSGKAQFIIVQQDSLDSDKGFEIDNTEAPQSLDLLPRVNAKVYNVTMVGAEAPASTSGVASNNVNDAMHLRRGARPSHFNMLIIGYPRLMDLDDDAGVCPAGVDLTTEVKWQSVTAFNFTTIDNTDIETLCQPYPASSSIEDNFFNDAANGNSVAATLPLIAPYNVLTPDWRPVSAAAVSQGASTVPPADGFFDATANYRGAVAPLAGGGIPWYAGWTVPFQSNTAP